MSDYSCLAEGYVVEADFAKTGVNQNELIVGPTGSGKSMSNGYSRLTHTTESSVVVPISKKEMKKRFNGMFRDRGYQVMDLDFSDPAKSEIGYDPMDFIRSESDVVQTARNLIGAGDSRSHTGDVDPYWNDSATSVLTAEISLVMIRAKEKGRRPCIADVVELQRNLKIDYRGGLIKTSLDAEFDLLEKCYPGNQASMSWNVVRNLAPKTASCIFSIVYGVLDKIFSEPVIAMSRKSKRVDFTKLGKERTILFITTSPMNKTLLNLMNMMYADMFRTLFECAEKREEGRLEVPVHIICDDFACSGKIEDFENYISIFRAAGISVTLLLQSESQLFSMYGVNAGTTIINNCDTYVYMGGMDLETCRHISQKTNKPLHKIMSMPLEQVLVFRRGSEPVMARRYQTLDDPIFREYAENNR